MKAEEDTNHDFRYALIVSSKALEVRDAMRIFTKYAPLEINLANNFTALCKFQNARICASAILDSSQTMRRVRYKVPTSENEEDGVVCNDGQDPIVTVLVKEEDKRPFKRSNVFDNVMELNVDKLSIPQGRYRVVHKHCSKKELILCSFAKHDDLAESHANNMEGWKASDGVKKPITTNIHDRVSFIAPTTPSSTIRFDPNDEMAKPHWNNSKKIIREGIQVFDAKGTELEWDYEHDTRTFEGGEADIAKNRRKRAIDEIESVMEGPGVTKMARGRGARSVPDVNRE
uniref:RRM_3 domain-containing protein n=1 Tax=Rhabditophanes sp. KR3021 TaxID=114890 RepID=A0AC35TJZ0_9BILA